MDQWMYHAVADTILANSLLRSLPEVDAAKVGLAGISWGGVITSTVMGIDDRFAFAIPVYGCGHLFDAGNHWGRALQENAVYREVWDPMQRMNRVTMPVLWLSWPGDNHFPLDCQAACYHAAPGLRQPSCLPAPPPGLLMFTATGSPPLPPIRKLTGKHGSGRLRVNVPAPGMVDCALGERRRGCVWTPFAGVATLATHGMRPTLALVPEPV